MHKVTHFSVVIHTNHYILDKEIEAVERSQYWCSSTFRCPPQYHNIHLAFQLEKKNVKMQKQKQDPVSLPHTFTIVMMNDYI